MECLEVLRESQIPVGGNWQYEIKLDGFRCIATCRKRAATLYSRNGNVFTQFPHVQHALSKLDETAFILDGELVALDHLGRPAFNALQQARTRNADVRYYIFDMIQLNGKDLSQYPLERRQKLLLTTFPALPSPLHHAQPLPGDLKVILKMVVEYGFEGIVAKRRDSIYTPGNAPGTWVKKKIKMTDEFVVGGYTPGSRGFDELVVGKPSRSGLVFVDAVKNGFIPAKRREVFSVIRKQPEVPCPFVNLPEKRGGGHMDAEKMESVRWVQPKIVVEIAMNEWTPGHHLRHSEFRRLRPDKTPCHVKSVPAV